MGLLVYPIGGRHLEGIVVSDWNRTVKPPLRQWAIITVEDGPFYPSFNDQLR